MKCPQCGGPLVDRSTPSVYLLECSACGARTFDGARSVSLGVDIPAVFANLVKERLPTTATCPVHGGAMGQAVVDGGEMFLYSACCSIVCLKQGQAEALQARLHRAPPALGTSLAPSAGATSRHNDGLNTCGYCGGPMTHHRIEGVDLDECPSCRWMFFEAGEPERIGIDTEALFTDEPWGAEALSNHERVLCALGHGVEAKAYRMQLLGSPFIAYVLPCCGGIYIGTDHIVQLRRASRKAVYDRAEAYAARGERAPRTRAQRSQQEQEQAESLQRINAVIKARTDGAIDRFERDERRLHDLLHGGRHGRRF
ncbi:MAG: zf-TFIIB domain-containing protein [Myxococcota bacterium]